jgi:hypothetical protein
MRKEKRGHARGTDDRGRAAHVADHETMVMRQDGGAGGKGKGTGSSVEKEDCVISGWRKIRGGGLWELERRKRFKRFLSE